MDSKHLIVLGDEETVTSMRLAGVKNAYVVNESNIMEVYDKVKGENALFIITQQAGELLGQKVDELRKTAMVQVIPESVEGYSTVKDLIKDVIGFDVRARA